MQKKRYVIEDLQGTGWWIDTETEPMTREEIIERFKSYEEDAEGFTHWSLKAIEDHWDCEITEYNKWKGRNHND